jgi:hypothetical protein
VGTDDLLRANPGIDPQNLQIGQVLCIPGVRDRVCRRGTLRVVRRGDTLYRIAQAEDVPLNTLIEANFWLPDPNLIYPGEQLCIPLVIPPAGCCIVLEPTAEAEGFNIGGIVLVEQFDDTSRVTFSGVNLPAPAVLGDFNSYAGDLVFREIERLVALGRCVEPGQEVVWSGSRVLDVPALAANLVVIFAYNSDTGARGPELLRGWIIDCR